MKINILAGITENNELYFLEIDNNNDRRNGYDEFSMAGFVVEPILLEDAHREVREYLEDGEAWREAVKSERTQLGLYDWVESVIDNDGQLAGFDNSLFDEFVEVDGQEYIFKSKACGQHKEKNLKHYFIEKEVFNILMNIWSQYHMKTIPTYEPVATTIKNIMKIKQDISALAVKAIKLINNEVV